MPAQPRPPRPRFLAAGQGNGSGYTSTPLRECPLVADETDVVDGIRAATNIRDEPEAIGPAIVDGYAEVAQFQHSQQHMADVLAAQQTRPTLKPAARVADLRRRAKDSHTDLSHELHILTRELDKARMAERDVSPQALDRIARLEALLDGVELAA